MRRMSVARCCCSPSEPVEPTCNVLGITYTAAKALVSNSSDVLQTRTNWDSNSFMRPPSSLVDHMTITTNSLGKVNSSTSGNYWESFGSSNGFLAVIASVGRPDYSVAQSAYPNEWNCCDNNTLELLFDLSCIATPASMNTGPGYDAFPTVAYGCSVSQQNTFLNGMGVQVVTTLDRDAGTYSTAVLTIENEYPDDQSSGVTPVQTTTSYPVTSTASSHSCSIKIRKSSIASAYTDSVLGAVDKWKVEYDVTVGSETVTIPNFEFSTLVRSNTGSLISPLKPYLYEHGHRMETYYNNVFRARYSDVSVTLSDTDTSNPL